MELNRRNLFKMGGVSLLGAASLTVPFGAASLQAASASRLRSANFPKRYAVDLLRPTVLRPEIGADGTARYDITARQGSAQIVPGLTTPVFGYNGSVPGPIISVKKGTPAVVTMRNHLPKNGPFGGNFNLSTHLHGSASLPQYDGYASDTTGVGFYKGYHYPNFQPARTLWYHDHGVHWTAQNAYSGLAAQYHLHDDAEMELLPQGEFDVPLTVNDTMFAANGSLAYDDNSHSGLWGDIILVNGRPWPKMTVQRRTYRFRILNASISRSYRWKLSNGMPLQVVAHDGGLAPKGVAVKSFRHGGAERYEVVIDFSKVPASTSTTRIELLNDSNPNNINYDFIKKVMAFDVLPSSAPVTTTREVNGAQQPDPTWNRDYDGFELVSSEIMSLQPTGREKVVKLRVERDSGFWTINGKTWVDVMDSEFKQVVANPEKDEVQVWEIENRSGGWFHPVHIHLIDFQVLTRNGKPRLPHEAGPKDVVYVGENETVRLLCKFTNQAGRYMVHCHNLPHEDHDMMQQFWVGSMDDDSDPNHPVNAARPQPDPTYKPS
jgi:spore coat protein A, manganese oxidase